MVAVIRFRHLKSFKIHLDTAQQGWGMRDSPDWVAASGAELDEHDRMRCSLAGGPIMRIESQAEHWPEYETLSRISAESFKLKIGGLKVNSNAGALPSLIGLMQSNVESNRALASIEQNKGGDSTSAWKADTSIVSRNSLPSSSISTSTIWQDTDDLQNKSIPLYN